MPNVSNESGYLRPASWSPEPLQGQALLRFLQQHVVGITGMNGTLVRASFSSDPSNIPDSGTCWASLAINIRETDNYPAVIHSTSNGGSDTLIRHEELDILASFYDTGAAEGLADKNCSLLRDGLVIAQNREPLLLNGMGLKSVGPMRQVPSLLKVTWLVRIDMQIIIARSITRVYAVEDVAIADIDLDTDITHGQPEPYSRHISIKP